MMFFSSYPIKGTLPSDGSSFPTKGLAVEAATAYQRQYPAMGYSTATEVKEAPGGFIVLFGRFASCD